MESLQERCDQIVRDIQRGFQELQEREMEPQEVQDIDSDDAIA